MEKRRELSTTVTRRNIKQDREDVNNSDCDYDAESESDSDQGTEQLGKDSRSSVHSRSASSIRQHENMSPIDWVAFCE